MVKNYSSEYLTKELLQLSRSTVEALTGLKDTLEKINDGNVLHSQKEDQRYAITNTMVESNKQLIKQNNTFIKVFYVVLFVLVAALVVLAGAEKALKIIPPIL